MESQLKKVLTKVQNGELSPDEAMKSLKSYPYEDLDYAKIDHHRELRRGFPEIVYGLGKTKEQIANISKTIIKNGSNLLVTRIAQETYADIKEELPQVEYNDIAKTMTYKQKTPPAGKGKIAIITAGTSDVPVAEEAAVTCDILGNEIEKIYDVGVAGIHRLFGEFDKVKECRVIITAAGMEGALPSVIAGITDIPIIAVPTSVGYGANLNGLTALLAMLNSCPGGVAVVNIDNGFGAAYMASLINHQ